MWIGLLLFFGLPAYSFTLPDDGLCFLNHDPELARVGIPILGRLGVKSGVCQGMSGIVNAVADHVVFNPVAPRESALRTKQKINTAIISYLLGGSAQKIEIQGYENLNELCKSQRRFFLRKSILLNADIAIREIAPVLVDFWIHKKKPIKSLFDRHQLHRTLSEFERHLARGHTPLMLLHSHVISVISIEKSSEGVMLIAYDSNLTNLRKYKVPYERDGLPARGQPKFWDITPKSRLRL